MYQLLFEQKRIMLTRLFSLTNILSTTSINLKFQKTLTIFYHDKMY